MADHFTLLDRIKAMFGVRVPKEPPLQAPPRSDFRNPIWGDDDEDDDDLFERNSNVVVYNDPSHLHSEISKQVEVMMKSFSSLFGDMSSFFTDDPFMNMPPPPPSDTYESDTPDSNRLRSYYLKPGYHKPPSTIQPHEDTDLDGKLSSQDLTGFLEPKDIPDVPVFKRPINFFSQTVITTKITKPDGSVETRRIIKKGDELTEETTTSGPLDPKLPTNTGFNSINNFSIINNIVSEIASLYSNIH